MQFFQIIFGIVFLVGIEKNALRVNAVFVNETELNKDLEHLLVNLPYGKLLGKDNGYYYSYESIPYAQPPLGALRYESPQPYAENWTDIYDGRIESPACMQWFELAKGENKLIGQEDCLTISVYRPNSKDILPVIVLIHGGAFMFGAVNAFQHDLLMKSGKFVVAKIAYRLGPLGFLSTEDSIISGNFGLKDQRLALKWIKENIAAFNGDSNSILMAGFSAGGASVHMHLLHKDTSEFVNAAYSCSGNALNPWVFTRNARERAFKIAELLQCDKNTTSQHIKLCLQNIDAEKIVQTVPNFLVLAYNPFTTFGAVIEHKSVPDAFINKPIKDMINAEHIAKIPWLVSYVTEDGGYNAAELLMFDSNGIELIEQLNQIWMDFAPAALFFSHLPKDEKEIFANNLKKGYMGEKNFSRQNYMHLEQIFTDIIFKSGVKEVLQLHKQIRDSGPIYTYCYDNPADFGYGQALADRTDLKFGTVHGDDFFLIFPRPFCKKELRDDLKINSDRFLSMLEQFAKNGNMSFGSCEFNNNIGKPMHQWMYIKGTNCENIESLEFPDQQPKISLISY